MASKHGRVMAIAVHDLRTPLAVVSGYVGLLLRQQADSLSARQREILVSVDRAVGSLTRIVSDLSDISNFESLDSTPTRRKVNLGAVVRQATTAVMESDGTTIAIHGTLHGATLLGEGERLQAAFRTIVSTTRKEIPEPQPIVVQQLIRDTRSRKSALVATGESDVVEKLLRAGPRGLTAFDSSGGARNLAGILACRVVATHGGGVWVLRGAQRGPGIMVELPVKSS